MAYELIGTYKINEYEQEEITEIQEVADPDTGVVSPVEILHQQYFHTWSELEVLQQKHVEENRSDFIFNLYAYCEAGEKGNDFRIFESAMDSSYFDYYIKGKNNTSTVVSPRGGGHIEAPDITIPKGNLTKIHLNKFDTTMNCNVNATLYRGINNIYHNLDGSYTISLICQASYNVEGIICNDVANTLYFKKTYVADIPAPIDRAVYPITANNFTDEENPTFTYKATTGKVGAMVGNGDTINSLQVALSFDGEVADITYRSIPVDGSSYTISLTEAERELLRQRAQGSDTVPIYYITKIIRAMANNSSITATLYGKTQRILTIVGCNPQLNPTVKDIKLETLALTGDENTFIRYESMAEYAINATASKHATIVSQSVTCGSKTISNLPNGVIDDVESGTFIFNVIDSRGMAASSSVFKELVEYVKPTCYQKAEIEISGETGANIKVTVNGNYFDGSFGAVNNTLKLEARYAESDKEMGNWITLTGTPTFNGNTYKLEATFSGFDYGKAYVFQCRATDKLNFVESAQYTIRMLPVFDWSEEDFNFNVPVNIDAEDLNMHGETIIRHSETTNNTVLSASNGNIYVRPKGTDNTSGETIFYGNGNVKFNGTVTLADGTTISGDPLGELGDYVIDAGSTSMGSNGTWYWRKWASGTAEAWGCRNFGSAAVNTAWGNLYRSAIFTQDLPYNVFIRTPDAININIVHSNFGGWICKHEQTAPSADTTGSFIFVRPASAQVSPTNIGFYVVGEWK